MFLQTSSQLAMFLLAMVLNPDVQRCAQAQIDDVVGRSRLPAFSDRPRLPYVEAVVQECLRWRPVGPMAIPRKTAQVSSHAVAL